MMVRLQRLNAAPLQCCYLRGWPKRRLLVQICPQPADRRYSGHELLKYNYCRHVTHLSLVLKIQQMRQCESLITTVRTVIICSAFGWLSVEHTSPAMPLHFFAGKDCFVLSDYASRPCPVFHTQLTLLRKVNLHLVTLLQAVEWMLKMQTPPSGNFGLFGG